MLPKDQASPAKLKVEKLVSVNTNNKTETENLKSEHSDSKKNDTKITEKNWLMEVNKLNLSGALKQLASHCSFKSIKNNILNLIIDSDHEHLITGRLKSRLNKSLISHFQQISGIKIEVDNASGQTLAKKKSELNEEQMILNESRLKSDPNIQRSIDIFDAKIEN